MKTPANLPRNVRVFEWLSYLSISIDLLATLFSPDTMADFAGFDWRHLNAVDIGLLVAGASFITAFLAAYIALIWLTSRRRRNWARWTLLFFCVLICALDCLDVLSDPGTLLDLLVYGMQFAALVLIFTGDARQWFAASKSP